MTFKDLKKIVSLETIPINIISLTKAGTVPASLTVKGPESNVIGWLTPSVREKDVG